MEHSWVLVGMMGAGKSSIGRTLAERNGRQFTDTDAMIQQRLGRSIAQIFQLYGEPSFRCHETSVIKGLSPGPFVVSTGGGVVVVPENWELLQRLGPIIYLKASPETLINRLEISKKKRPLLDVEDWQDRLRTLLAQRTPSYERADIVVTVDDEDMASAAEQIERAVAEWRPR